LWWTRGFILFPLWPGASQQTIKAVLVHCASEKARQSREERPIDAKTNNTSHRVTIRNSDVLRQEGVQISNHIAMR
jgi:hypothetical protein